GSRAQYHQAVPHITPAKMQPAPPPNPRQPRTAQLIAPSAANRTVGSTRSFARSRRFGFITLNFRPPPQLKHRTACVGFLVLGRCCGYFGTWPFIAWRGREVREDSTG